MTAGFHVKSCVETGGLRSDFLLAVKVYYVMKKKTKTAFNSHSFS